MEYRAVVIVGLLALCIIGPVFLGILSHRKAVRDLDRFQQSFPGKCPVCSFRHYGMLHGFDSGTYEVPVYQDEVTRTESNRLPGQRYWTGSRDRKIVCIDVSRMSVEQAEGAILAAKDILSKPVLPPNEFVKVPGWRVL